MLTTLVTLTRDPVSHLLLYGTVTVELPAPATQIVIGWPMDQPRFDRTLPPDVDTLMEH
jgi:hypothetical protein